MAQLKAGEVDRFLARPDFSKKLYLVYGPDAGAVRETGQALIERYLENDRDAERITLEGAAVESDPGALVIEARTGSLFGGRRAIRVRNAGKASSKALDALLDGESHALVVFEAGALAPKDGLRATAERDGRVLALPRYADTEQALASVLRRAFADARIEVDAETLRVLADLLGNDREVTRRELEKLVLYAMDTGRLTTEDVMVLCGDNAAQALDAVLDAAGGGHAEDLARALTRSFEHRDPQMILSMSANHFAQLRRWRAEFERGEPVTSILQRARPRPHFTRSDGLARQVRLWTDEKLASAQESVRTALEDARRRPALAETITERCLFGICRLGAAP